VEICEPLYQSGYSLSEICAMTGFPQSTIRDQLVRAGVTLRAAKSVTFSKDLRQSFKNSASPPFGFVYLEGRLQKDAKEFPVLQIIWQQWRQGRSATDITHFLNGKKLKTRNHKEWKRTTVLNILERFENKTTVL